MAPVRGCANKGLLISSTVPIFDAPGHAAGSGVNRSVPASGPVLCTPVNPTCPSEHASRPSAPEGFTCTPSGSVTVVPRSADSARPVATPVVSCGTCTATVTPVGELPASPSDATTIDGVNGSWLQPAKPAERPIAEEGGAIQAAEDGGGVGAGLPAGLYDDGTFEESLLERLTADLRVNERALARKGPRLTEAVILLLLAVGFALAGSV